MTREGARGFAALDHRIPPPVIGALIAGLMWVAAGASPTLGVPPSLLRPLAVVLGVVALGIDSAARLASRATER